MQSSTTDNLHYQNIRSYRYRVTDDLILIPFLNEDLAHAVSFIPPVIHPFFVITEKGVAVKKNYAWDGATYAFNTKNLIVPSLVHDVLCQAISLGLLSRKFRADADKEYFLQSLGHGVAKTRAVIQYGMIRVYATLTNIKTKNPAPFDTEHSIGLYK